LYRDPPLNCRRAAARGGIGVATGRAPQRLPERMAQRGHGRMVAGGMAIRWR
jgi:hypothetical protein